MFNEENIDIFRSATASIYDAICFTSNGFVNTITGKLIMDAGVAEKFKKQFPLLDVTAGKKVLSQGNICQIIDHRSHRLFGNKAMPIVSFPTKTVYFRNSDIKLIEKSAKDLMKLIISMEWRKVLLPRPGCTNGGLKWEDVKKVLLPILDSRVTITAYREWY